MRCSLYGLRKNLQVGRSPDNLTFRQTQNVLTMLLPCRDNVITLKKRSGNVARTFWYLRIWPGHRQSLCFAAQFLSVVCAQCPAGGALPASAALLWTSTGYCSASHRTHCLEGVGGWKWCIESAMQISRTANISHPSVRCKSSPSVRYCRFACGFVSSVIHLLSSLNLIYPSKSIHWRSFLLDRQKPAQTTSVQFIIPQAESISILTYQPTLARHVEFIIGNSVIVPLLNPLRREIANKWLECS